MIFCFFFFFCNNKNLLKKKQALKQEIQIMRKITHPNIIKLHEIYEGQNHIYLV